ncbi:MAG: Enoyl-[acyl-carrier-protein] reductase [FMN], partial [uncultured Acidimicrobiales bacterium]
CRPRSQTCLASSTRSCWPAWVVSPTPHWSRPCRRPAASAASERRPWAPTRWAPRCGPSAPPQTSPSVWTCSPPPPRISRQRYAGSSRVAPACSWPVWASHATSWSSATAAGCSSSTCAARFATPCWRWRRAATSWWPRAPRPGATPARWPPWPWCRRSSMRSVTGCRWWPRAGSSTAEGWPRRWLWAQPASGWAPGSSPRPRHGPYPATRTPCLSRARTAPPSRALTRARRAGSSATRTRSTSTTTRPSCSRSRRRSAGRPPTTRSTWGHHPTPRASTPRRSSSRRARASEPSTSWSVRPSSCGGSSTRRRQPSPRSARGWPC